MDKANSTKKSLTAIRINALKSEQTLSDIGENAGLNVSCSKKGIKTFFYRYRSPIDNKVKRLLLGVFVNAVINEDLELPLGKIK